MTTWWTKWMSVGGMSPLPKPKAAAAMVNAPEVKWRDAPPELPRGAQLGVLHGDPAKPGPFAVRLKLPSGYKIAPHCHSQDKHLTVIAGTLVLHLGDSLASEPYDLKAGAYHFLPRRTHHAAETKGETIIQINGMGPFDFHYLWQSDNPDPKGARS